ncbi:glycosyltransferase family 2 protein [Polaribacter sargassicola]|uniref:glycosyltransferase family 2 protein n=1 Tax=Polaribacter sargassicola TaxID=2836891 RepID=UPI001F3425CD|nr:glycosyltransferase family A protein [Polaribacter sp. DS7-9]MCG1037806.1 glycosyltransferase family 2 protein [Polaribacter sp. DS7-9]
MERRLISVVIPNFNNSLYLKQCISSVLNQTYSCIECIVIDDNSNDDSVDIIKTLQEEYSNLSFYKNEINKGVSYSRNKGAELAKGEYISFLDADDYWLPTKLETELDLIEKTNAKLVFSPYKWFDSKKTFDNTDALKNPRTNVFDYWKDSLISPSGLTVEKTFFNKVGGFDTNLKGAEDMDFFFRCALIDLNILSTEKFNVKIRIHEGNTKKNYQRMYDGHIISLKKWCSLVDDNKQYKTSEYIVAVRNKLSKARYYASMLNSKELKLNTFKIGFKIFGLKYFNKVLVFSLYKIIFNGK